jgi:hypothetical protein
MSAFLKKFEAMHFSLNAAMALNSEAGQSLGAQASSPAALSPETD